MAEFDIVVRGGTVVDGSGAAPFVGDVAIRDGRIAEVGVVVAAGREEIDATGLLVTPGFVDVHTHYDGQVFWDDRLAPSSQHGVTTVVLGNCGVGFAPVRPGQRELLVALMEGVEDIPEVVMAAGVPFDWETFPEFLDALSRRETDIDFAAQLPHSALRVYVMGERAVAELPTEADLAAMRRLTAEALAAGALGVSTSRNWAHRFIDGRPAPSVNTIEDEFLALAQGLRDAGAGVFQIAPDVRNPAREEFGVLRRICETAGRPLSFSFLAGAGSNWRDYLAGMDDAAAAGLQMRGQAIPRSVGFLFGLDLSFHPFSLNPSFRALADLPLAEKVARMREPALRAQLLSEAPESPNPLHLGIVSDTRLLFRLGDPPNYNPRLEDSLAAQAAASGRDVREVIYDELLRDEGRAILFAPKGNVDGDDIAAGRRLFAHEHVLLGLGDGGAHYGMLCDAGITTYFLTACVRDDTSDEAVPLARAVKLMTRDAAGAVGLFDRGLLAPGMKADLNLIDFAALALAAPEVVRDLPSGGRRVTQRAAGYRATIVSGEVTYRDGIPTGRLPGRLVRGQNQQGASLAA